MAVLSEVAVSLREQRTTAAAILLPLAAGALASIALRKVVIGVTGGDA